MDFSAANYGLPVSRTDALSIVVLGVLSAFFGATPGKHKRIALVFTVLAHIWAIDSSVIAFHEVVTNSHGMEPHIWRFLLGLLILTIVTSLLALLSLWGSESETLFFWSFAAGLAVMLGVFLVGLIELLAAYAVGCDQPRFATAALCQHSTGYVVGVVIGIGVCGLIGAGLVTFCMVSLHNDMVERAGCVVQTAWKLLSNHSGDDTQPLMVSGAIFTRTGALAKVCLLGCYWCLLGNDLNWQDTANDNGIQVWVIGQWVKQGIAIANNFFNCLC